MKTVTLEVSDLLSILDFAAVEKRLANFAGVHSVAINAGSSSASITYDERATGPERLVEQIRACGFHCRGEVAPRHVCVPNETLAAEYEGHAAHRHDERAHSVPLQQKTAAPTHDATAHEMGHASGMSMDEMVRDMRNRFIVSLGFTIPIFALDPMGLAPPLFEPPFGLSVDITMFILASGAILYPVWPFVVAAVRALGNGILNMAVLVLLSVGTGYLFSVGSTFLFDGQQFYEAVAVLLVFILLGHWLEMRARAGASAAIRALLDLAPPKSTVLRNGREIDVATHEVQVGDIVVLRPGVDADRRVAAGDQNRRRPSHRGNDQQERHAAISLDQGGRRYRARPG